MTVIVTHHVMILSSRSRISKTTFSKQFVSKLAVSKRNTELFQEDKKL